MTQSLRVLGQATLTDSTEVAVYTVTTTPHAELAPRSIMQSIVTSILVCNTNAAAKSYTLKVVPFGEVSAVKHTIISSKSVPSNGTDSLNPGITMRSGDIIYGIGDTSSNFSISIFGIEIL